MIVFILIVYGAGLEMLQIKNGHQEGFKPVLMPAYQIAIK